MKARQTVPKTDPQTLSARVELQNKIIVFDPNAVVSAARLRELLGLKATSLRREVRLGRLRVHKVCGRHYFLGTDILEWIRSGRIAPKRQAANPANSESADKKI